MQNVEVFVCHKQFSINRLCQQVFFCFVRLVELSLFLLLWHGFFIRYLWVRLG